MAQGKTEPQDRVRENRAVTGGFLEEEVYLLRDSTVYLIHICWGSQDPLLSEQEASGSSQETTGDIPVDAAREGLKKELFSWALEETQALQRKSQVTVSRLK